MQIHPFTTHKLVLFEEWVGLVEPPIKQSMNIVIETRSHTTVIRAHSRSIGLE